MTAATQQAGSPDNEPVRVNHTVRNIVIALIVVAVMSAGRVVERGDVCNVFAAPQQAVTKRFIDTVSGSAIGSITYEFSGDDALVRDFLGGAVTFQRCHRLRHGGGPQRNSDFYVVSRGIGLGHYCNGGVDVSVHAYDIAGHQTDWTVIRNSTRR